MSVKVNLLPQHIQQDARERRIALGAATGLVIWMLLLALFFVQQMAAASHTGNVRDDEQAELVRLQARANELEPYRELARRFDAGNALLASSMAGQLAWSGLLNDLALVFPANSSLLTMDITTPVGSASTGAPQAPGMVGSVLFTGYSVERYAPGVESVLLGMDDAAVFESLYLSAATRGLIGSTQVTNFTGSARLTDRVFTGRFLMGLPEDER